MCLFFSSVVKLCVSLYITCVNSSDYILSKKSRSRSHGSGCSGGFDRCCQSAGGQGVEF